jgi:uncharacterized protein (TIGR00299 family) protein
VPQLNIHLDAVGGVAGDMFLAAMADAFPDLVPVVLAAQRAAGLPDDVHCRFTPHHDEILTGKRFLVDDPHEHAHRHAHAHGVEHHHDETPFAQIRARLLASALDADTKRHAVAIFSLLAQVEAEVHGVSTDAVRFHELGGWDSIADIVGAAACITHLGDAAWSCSALPLGRGRVRIAHGWVPVPSPAASKILRGYAFFDDGLEGERITPTGAAILKHVGASQDVRRGTRRLLRIGNGFGTKVFPGLSNVLRVLAFEDQAAAPEHDQVVLIAFEVDDQSPEDLAIGLDHLRAKPGVLDVLQVPAFGKKGRMVAHVQILAEPAAADAVREACFNETTTLGVRAQVVERCVLPRQHAAVTVGEQTLRVKVAQRPGAVATAKVESDDLRTLQGGSAARARARRKAEEEGLKDG